MVVLMVVNRNEDFELVLDTFFKIASSNADRPAYVTVGHALHLTSKTPAQCRKGSSTFMVQ